MHPRPKVENLIGVWLSDEGAELNIKRDGSINLKNFPLNLVNNDLDKSLSGNGIWEFNKSESISPFWVLDVTVNDDTNKIVLELLISRSGLGGNNSKITTLFIWKGDPDLDDRYEFYKQ